jgi:hypothetical protein
MCGISCTNCGTDHCLDHGTTSECVECIIDDHCASSEVCNLDNLCEPDTDTGTDTGSDTGCAAGEVFVNELHYDNDGDDTGEAIEVAGPAGTDLTGWSLVLYNGNNQLVYDTTPLSGTIPDQQAGMGTVAVFYPMNGIQNGAPDGIALVDDTSTVLQFLSYEGTFDANGGPADGMTSIDIGVSENWTTPIGDSLQLMGYGCVYADFTWTTGSETFDAINAAQTFGI